MGRPTPVVNVTGYHNHNAVINNIDALTYVCWRPLARFHRTGGLRFVGRI